MSHAQWKTRESALNEVVQILTEYKKIQHSNGL